MASFRCVSTKIPSTILSYRRKRLFRRWQRMPSGRKLQRFEAKRVARFTFVASWNSPRPVIIVARSGAKASRGPETMSTGRNNKVEGKSSWNSSSYLENVHLVSRGQKRKRKEVWKEQRRLIYIRTRYRNINIPAGSMLGLYVPKRSRATVVTIDRSETWKEKNRRAATNVMGHFLMRAGDNSSRHSSSSAPTRRLRETLRGVSSNFKTLFRCFYCPPTCFHSSRVWNKDWMFVLGNWEVSFFQKCIDRVLLFRSNWKFETIEAKRVEN